MREYLLPIVKITSYFKNINSKQDLQKFIQQRSAHITQNTLYGYLKTRMGHKYTIMVDDDVYSKSINIEPFIPIATDESNKYHSNVMVEQFLNENKAEVRKISSFLFRRYERVVIASQFVN